MKKMKYCECGLAFTKLLTFLFKVRMSKKLVKEPLITLAERQYKKLVNGFENGPNTRLVFANYLLTKLLKSLLGPFQKIIY
jgi:hypothetical protein